MTPDDLDLARAKAILEKWFGISIEELMDKPELTFTNNGSGWLGTMKLLMCAIRPADAAMGVVSVPVATLNKAIRLLVRCHDRIHVMPRITDTELATEVASMAAMLAASPLREKPDEP